jgi:cell wall-associated NlpC family hydrolase
MRDVPERLAILVVLLAAVMTGACAARAGVPRPFPGAALPPGAAQPDPGTAQPTPSDPDAPPLEPSTAPPGALLSGTVGSLISTALGYQGVPYRNGGSDPSGFDCSGFIQYVFSRFGAFLPREVRDQFREGREIELKDVKPGDLLFFETVSRGASHVGLVISGNQFVHAPSSRGVVRVERFTAPYWARRFLGARRIVS